MKFDSLAVADPEQRLQLDLIQALKPPGLGSRQ
jgi:hypothetical protein